MNETYSIVLKLKEYRGIIQCIVLIHFSTFKVPLCVIVRYP